MPYQEFDSGTRLVFGAGVADRLGALVREYGGTSALLVTDPGIVAAGHLEKAVTALHAAGVRTTVFDGVRENPTRPIVAQCVARARKSAIDFLVGFGGGSSMDVAKGCNLTLGGRPIEDYRGGIPTDEPLLPMIAVPTTAGTGSECQSYALISHETTHQKMACGTPGAAPRAALLDPCLTLTQPKSVAACTAMDALSHAVEAAVTTRRTNLSGMYAFESFRLGLAGARGIVADPEDIAARGSMLMGAALAGLAIEKSMLGAAHAAANPLTAHFGIVHGQAIALTLPEVVRFNAQDPDARRTYRELATAAGLAASDDSAGDRLADVLEDVRQQLGLAPSLRALGVDVPDPEILADAASAQWTAQFNPREVAVADFARLYQTLLGA